MSPSGSYLGQENGGLERAAAGSFANAAQASARYLPMDISLAVSASRLASAAVCHTAYISAPCQAPLSGFSVRRRLGKSAK